MTGQGAHHHPHKLESGGYGHTADDYVTFYRDVSGDEVRLCVANFSPRA